MRVTTKAVYDKDFNLLEWEGFEYEGPVAMCGGGPSDAQKRAAKNQEDIAAQQLALSKQNAGREAEQYALIKPYATSRLNNGLPFYKTLTDYAGGVSSRAYAPARAATLRRLTSMGDLPSGFREASLRDIDLARARDFSGGLVNNELMNEQAKSEAARLLTNQQVIANPLAWYQAGANTNTSIMNAPLATPGWGGFMGGVLSSLGSGPGGGQSF